MRKFLNYSGTVLKSEYLVLFCLLTIFLVKKKNTIRKEEKPYNLDIFLLLQILVMKSYLDFSMHSLSPSYRGGRYDVFSVCFSDSIVSALKGM